VRDLQAAGGATLNADEATGGAVATDRVGGAAGRRARRAVAVLVGTAAGALILDQIVKQLSVRLLDPSDPVRLLGGALYLSLVRNSGAAFSLGSGYTVVFPIVTLAVVGWIAWMTRRLRSVPWAISLGLVLGGALGNLSDRLFRAAGPLVGHVVDMISVFAPYGQRFAVFNVADSCLSVGVVLAVLLELTGRQRDGARATPSARATPGKAAGRDGDAGGSPPARDAGPEAP
jgi:signal peptidase II